MAAIYYMKDGQRVYQAKDGGETTDRKKATKYKGCASWAVSARWNCGDKREWLCDCKG